MKAFMGAYQSYAIKPIEENKYNYSNFISDSRLTIKKTLDASLAKLHGLKVKLSFKGWFSVGIDGSEDNWAQKTMISNIHEIINSEDVESAVETATAEIIKEIEDFVQYKSGWVFEQNIKINVNIYKYQPIRGSSYIELPEIIQRQACINIKNVDQNASPAA